MKRSDKSPCVFRGTTVLGLLVAGGLLSCSATEPEADAERSARAVTPLGELVGAAGSDGVAVFRGVPFAQPPTGDLRFRPARPVKAWAEAYDATSFGAPCYQLPTPETTVYSRGPLEDRSEDCLYLNVWTPALSASGSLPVMVWFHGGSHAMGHGHSPIFDGTNLALKGAVVVTVNYRLGVFGFLAHPALSAESGHGASGNYGLHDKVVALEWVRDNVAAFGGDPENVTIFGQSAGSASVCALMASPLAEGLFHRAIGQSAGCLGPVRRLDSGANSGHEMGELLARHLGLESEGEALLRSLRALSAEELEAASQETPGFVVGLGVDGWVLERAPRDVFAAGDHHSVPLLVGSTADEASALFPEGPSIDVQQLRESLSAQFGVDDVSELLAAYAAEIEVSAAHALVEVQSDILFLWGSRAWARSVAVGGAPAYVYYMTQEMPVFKLYLTDRPELEGYEAGRRGLGAYHSGDLAYAFGNTRELGVGWDESDHALGDAMSSYWVQFARSGDPNAEGLPDWPRWTPESDSVLELGPGTPTHENFEAPKIAALDALLLSN